MKNLSVQRIFTLIVFFLHILTIDAQVCFDGRRRGKPHTNVWGRPRSVQLNLLDREYSQGVHFGFGMGLNTFDFSSIRMSGETVYVPGQGNAVLYADLVHAKPGYNINAIMDYRLTNTLNVRFLPGIFFGHRTLDFYREDTQSIVNSLDMASNYFEFPFVIKYSATRYSNVRPYVLAGINPRLNLSNKVNESAKRYFGMKKLESFGETGFGFDFYLENFRMGIELKVSIGLGNGLNDEASEGFEIYRKSLSFVRSNMAVVTLNFEL